MSSKPKRSKKREQNYSESMASDSNPDSDFEQEETTTKKKKTTASTISKKKGASKAGKLAGWMNNLPFDIFCEVGRYLSPLDLLRLSSSSKSLRALLISPAANSIWHVARRQYGLPTLLASTTLTEWQYANLLFVKKCQECGVPCVVFDAFLRVRLCHSCRETRFEYSPKGHPGIEKCCVSTKFTPRNWKRPGYLDHYSTEDVKIISTKLYDLEASDKKNGTSLLKEYVAERENIVAQVKKDAANLMEAGLKLDALLKQEADAAKSVKARVVAGRYSFITGKLRALGYNSSDFASSTFAKSSLVTRSEALTDASWETLKPGILKLLAKVKVAQQADVDVRDVQSRQRKLHTSYHNLKRAMLAPQSSHAAGALPSASGSSTKLLFPLLGDFLHFESVKPYWEAGDVEFTIEAWNDNLEPIKAEVEEYSRQARMEAIRQILVATTGVTYKGTSSKLTSYPESKYDDAFFSRATSSLFCSLPDCRKEGSIEEDWDDRTMAPSYFYSPRRNTFFGSLYEVFDHNHSFHAYNNADALSKGHFELPPYAAICLSKILPVVDLDPATATLKDLDDIRDFHLHVKNAKGNKWWEWRDLMDDFCRRATGPRSSKKEKADPVIIRAPLLGHFGITRPATPQKPEDDEEDESDDD